MYLMGRPVGPVKDSQLDLSHNFVQEVWDQIQRFKIFSVYYTILLCLTTPNFCVQLVQLA
jgi:hypothetical protein